jgi:hypothetical protein
VDVDSHIAFGGDERLAGVNSDSYPDGALGESSLPFARRLDSVPCSRERVEERVSLGVDLDATALGERGPEDPAMFREDVCVRIAEAVQRRVTVPEGRSRTR